LKADITQEPVSESVVQIAEEPTIQTK